MGNKSVMEHWVSMHVWQAGYYRLYCIQYYTIQVISTYSVCVTTGPIEAAVGAETQTRGKRRLRRR